MSEYNVGVIGLGCYGRQLLAALGGNDRFKVTAVADMDRERAEECAQEYDAQPYDDYRSLIVQQKLDVVFLAVPAYQCGECIALAAKLQMHVFKGAPLARTLPEGVGWVKLMAASGRRLEVGTPKRFSPGYQQAHNWLEEGRIGSVYLVRAESFMHHVGDFDWRGDPILAGGGVLIERGYHLIDQMIWNMGPPERLYSLNTNWCSKKVLPPYRTEDTAVVMMSFPDGNIGSVVCSCMTGPEKEKLVVHGAEGSMEVTEDRLILFDPQGRVVEEEVYEISGETELIGRQIEHFGASLADSEIEPVSTAREHLASVAVVEAAYLSARTQLPETLKVYGSVFEI